MIEVWKNRFRQAAITSQREQTSFHRRWAWFHTADLEPEFPEKED
jgi:hypothetical protein